MAARRKPGPQCSHNDPVDISDGTMCLAASPEPGPLAAGLVTSPDGFNGKSVARMTHQEKIEAAIKRARDKGLISKEILNQLPSAKELVIGIVVVGGVLAGLGVTAGAVASTGVGAVLEGIAAAIVLSLSALGIITSVGQIAAGIKTLMKFYEATRKAQTIAALDAAARDFATGLAEAGVGTIMMILSVLGARQGVKMGKGAAAKASAGAATAEEAAPRRTVGQQEPPPPEPKPVPGSIDESLKPFNPREKSIAQYLADEGHTVQSVPESTVENVRTPDALVDGKGVEFKSLDPGATSATVRNQVNESIRGMGQARDVIVDARGSGLDAAEAERGLARVGGIARGKLDSVRIIGDGYDVQKAY
jgi:contact-dependent growth inhibition (CDI) system CdiA-like toxin